MFFPNSVHIPSMKNENKRFLHHLGWLVGLTIHFFRVFSLFIIRWNIRLKREAKTRDFNPQTTTTNGKSLFVTKLQIISLYGVCVVNDVLVFYSNSKNLY